MDDCNFLYDYATTTTITSVNNKERLKIKIQDHHALLINVHLLFVHYVPCYTVYIILSSVVHQWRCHYTCFSSASRGHWTFNGEFQRYNHWHYSFPTTILFSTSNWDFIIFVSFFISTYKKKIKEETTNSDKICDNWFSNIMPRKYNALNLCIQT